MECSIATWGWYLAVVRAHGSIPAQNCKFVFVFLPVWIYLLIATATAGDKNTQFCCNTQQDNIKQGNNNVGVLNQPFSYFSWCPDTEKICRKGQSSQSTIRPPPHSWLTVWTVWYGVWKSGAPPLSHTHTTLLWVGKVVKVFVFNPFLFIRMLSYLAVYICRCLFISKMS